MKYKASVFSGLRPVSARLAAVILLLALTVSAVSGCGTGGISTINDIFEEFSASIPAASRNDADDDNDKDGDYSLRFNYSRLDDSEKRLYRSIKKTVFAFGESVSARGAESETFSRAYKAFCGDYPECFWLSGDWTACGYNSGKKRVYTEFKPSYLYGKERAGEITREIEKKTSALLAKAGGQSDDYGKAVIVYDYIVKAAEYDSGSADKLNGGKIDRASDRSCTIEGFFLDGRAVCSGYSKAMQYLFNKLGIECAYVTGSAGGGSHAWNLVRLDGDFYYIDATWGASRSLASGYVSYDYFCLTDEELFIDHTPDDEFTLPVCDSDDYGYYKRNGLLFERYERSDIAGVISSALENGEAAASFKFTQSAEYEAAVEALFDDGDIYEIMRGLSDRFPEAVDRSYTYIADSDRFIITVFLD